MRSAERGGATAQSLRSDKLYMENNLLRIAGALFCHDPKRAALRTAKIQLTAASPEKRITIRPDPTLGQPGQLAHKIFVALIKKHSDYGRPVSNEISFTRREIGRLIGRKEWGGKDSEQLSRALREIHYTFITTHFKESGRSLRDDHFVCLNHVLITQLGTIGQALYMRLFFHFANLYTNPAQSLAFQKRYNDICAEWLGGLRVHPQRSIVEHNQLGPHLRQLVAAGFLASYEIAKAKNAAGLVIAFTPGQGFFDDYDRFYRRRARGAVRAEAQPDQRERGDPLKL